ncbi:Holliday junction branch migration protein RuvA [Corynebacterium marinum]|uniref:Holliday junction branch migration complex subunit RuvA n=2 Tax=Corynebacterium marinum TaxID=349751 RepID=A0A0B6TM34_9CORY|nr:Holliday junction branch migration protein RuvA [Corynebacterium marinum]AJK68998.1 Holliday junction ATP-dependent DNA helicase RuvA [Corynebacterium marinum DSM 44953]NLF91977.1 Holliday junction branch migration protein RuvA [Corynebacterium marinum]GGO20194.1 Holliday junction ATP-dependent DNA helicase RuvA [Corynebacterium marinum]
MIASLRGTVIGIGLDHAVIECAGVGYRVEATPTTLATLRRGEDAMILTSLTVREDAHILHGFSSDEDRAMFHLLQSVSGLGPRLAVAALSVLNAGELSQAIAGEDAKALQRIPGVGKRMAERLILELKDKVATFVPAEPAGTAAPTLPTVAEAVAEQVVDALIGLGFSDRVAQPVVEGVLAEEPALDTSAALRRALTQLGRK